MCLQIRREFKSVAGFEDDIHSVLDAWQEWKEKIIQFAKLESLTRPILKKLLEALEECDELVYTHGIYVDKIVIVHLLIFLFKHRWCRHYLPRITD